jgi:hypothetical protein
MEGSGPFMGIEFHYMDQMTRCFGKTSKTACELSFLIDGAARTYQPGQFVGFSTRIIIWSTGATADFFSPYKCIANWHHTAFNNPQPYRLLRNDPRSSSI